jgi:hypothetical protein
MEEDRMPKNSSPKNWKRRDVGKTQKRMERGIRKRLLGVRRWRKMVTDRTKMEEYCSTGQSSQRAVVPMQEEEENLKYYRIL